MAVSLCDFESMGTRWQVRVWDDLSSKKLTALKQNILDFCNAFDNLYSRFIHTSLVVNLSSHTGMCEVPKDLVAMLRLYEKLYELSEGKFTPLVGDTLSDLGYNTDYLLKPKPSGRVRKVPVFPDVINIIDDTHIQCMEKTTIDVGALGKGYAVDCIAQMLVEHNIETYLVDGSGDIVYRGKDPIKVGLEHPHDPKKVIGSVNFSSGAMCSSASNRRSWGGMHHIIDPHTQKSPDYIVASWVIANSAALADGLATALFLSPPENFQDSFSFEYLLLDKNLRVKRSPGFAAELY